jgi:hypothetical protein
VEGSDPCGHARYGILGVAPVLREDFEGISLLQNALAFVGLLIFQHAHILRKRVVGNVGEVDKIPH